MPSAANAKSEKPASSEATDNTPIRQVMTIIEHKIRNLEKRKSKLTQYRDWQKAGKELNSDQRVAVAKYEEVAQTLEFARDIAKQIAQINTVAERDAKKQAKKDAWFRNAMETSKIREVLLILDCLTQMGSHEAREDFLNGTNGAAKLTEDDLKILDDLYPEVTPKHEPNEEGQPGFHAQTSKAAEHLCSIIDGKPKEVLGTTYSRIKEIVGTVHGCGYFDRVEVETVVEIEEVQVEEQLQEPAELEPEPELQPPVYPPPGTLPVPPAPAVVPAPAYPLRPLPPITLQEVEHAYFAQQYPQQRPIAEVIGSQNFFFLQESELDSPVATPQPPSIPNQPSPPGPIPTQTFTNQHFIQVQPGRVPEPGAMPMPPQPHFAPLPEHGAFPGAVPHPHLPPAVLPVPPHHPPQPQPAPLPADLSPHSAPSAAPAPAPVHRTEEPPTVSPAENKPDDDWIENASPERDEAGDRKTQGQGDGQGRFRRYGRGGGRGAPNGHRGGRGSYQNRQGGDGYRGRHGGDYQGRSNRDDGGYQGRSNREDGGYQGRSNREDGGYQGRSNREDGGYQGRSNKEDGGYQGRSNKEDGGYQGRSNKEDGGYQGRSNKEDGGYQGRSNKEDGGYHGRSNKEDGGYQGRSNKEDGGYQGRSHRDDGGYRNRQYDSYSNRHSKDSYQNKGTDDGYYGNGDTGDGHREQENGGRERYGDSNQNYQGGFKGRGRGGPRGAARGSSRPPRASHNYSNRKQENVE